jgi:DNA-binding LytR/AlgR family response regulator
MPLLLLAQREVQGFMEAIVNYLRDKARMLGVCALVGFLLALAGAFGSGQAPALNRFGFWVAIMPLGGLIGALTQDRVARLEMLDGRPMAYTFALALLVSIPMTGLVWLGLRIAFPTFEAGPLWILALVVFVLTLAMTTISLLVERGTDAASRVVESLPEPQTDPLATFRTKLPAKIRAGAIWALEAEDHYIRVHTSIGSDLILMRMADATDMLSRANGLRIHRSWWVSRDGIAGIKRGDGKVLLTLKDGTDAPVARARVAEVKAAGWGG